MLSDGVKAKTVISIHNKLILLWFCAWMSFPLSTSLKVIIIAVLIFSFIFTVTFLPLSVWGWCLCIDKEARIKQKRLHRKKPWFCLLFIPDQDVSMAFYLNLHEDVCLHSGYFFFVNLYILQSCTIFMSFSKIHPASLHPTQGPPWGPVLTTSSVSQLGFTFKANLF